MGTPLFSIVIPTYNRAHTLPRAINSCTAQTIRECEIVVVDEARSTDDVAGVLARLGLPNVRLIGSDRRTAAAARNAGARAARGRYVAFLDSDDEFLPTKLETCLARLEAEPGAAVYSQTYVDRGVGRLWVKPARGLTEGEDIYDYLLTGRGWVHPSTVALDARLACRYPFREDLRFGDDTQFAIDLWRNGVPLRMIEEPLAIYEDYGGAQQLSQAPVHVASGAGSGRAFIDWMESQRPWMSERAYQAYRARYYARFVARQAPRTAAGCVFAARRHGALGTAQAASQMLQIFLPATYRRLADVVARRAGRETPSALLQMRARLQAGADLPGAREQRVSIAS